MAFVRSLFDEKAFEVAAIKYRDEVERYIVYLYMSLPERAASPIPSATGEPLGEQGEEWMQVQAISGISRQLERQDVTLVVPGAFHLSPAPENLRTFALRNGSEQWVQSTPSERSSRLVPIPPVRSPSNRFSSVHSSLRSVRHTLQASVPSMERSAHRSNIGDDTVHQEVYPESQVPLPSPSTSARSVPPALNLNLYDGYGIPRVQAQAPLFQPAMSSSGSATHTTGPITSARSLSSEEVQEQTAVEEEIIFQTGDESQEILSSPSRMSSHSRTLSPNIQRTITSPSQSSSASSVNMTRVSFAPARESTPAEQGRIPGFPPQRRPSV